MNVTEFGTSLAERNPVVAEAASAVSELGVVEAAALAAMFSQENLPLYASSVTNPESKNPHAGLTSRDKAGFSCAARAGLVHAVLTENMRLYPVIASTYIEEYKSAHYFNVALDTDTGDIVVIDNGKAIDRKKNEVGTHELVIDPRSVVNTDPAVFSALFEVAIAQTQRLYENPLINLSRIDAPFLEAPTHKDLYSTDVRFHVRPENTPTDEELERYNLTRLKDTMVTVLNNDASNRLVDRFTGPIHARAA